jgi:KDO2-lipid IV(A) lauroyltransferase
MTLRVRLAAIGLRLAARLPLRLLHFAGAALARVVALAGTREFRVAKRNVELVYPSLPAAEQQRFLRATLAETGKSFTELPKVWAGDPRRALGLIRAVRGREHVDAALAGGRGVLIAAPHLGAWELLNLYLSTIGPLTILYRVPQRPEFEDLLVRSRSVLGAEAVRAEASGVRLLFRRLKEGRMVGILPDQRPKGGEGADAPFFGQPTRSMTLLSRLAEKTGAPVIFGFAERLPGAAGYVVHFLPAEPAIADPDPVVAVGALHRGLEACVAVCPTQYQWTYKRFSFREKGSGPDRVYGR